MTDATILKFNDWAGKGARQPGLRPLRRGLKAVALHHTVRPNKPGETPCDRAVATLSILRGRNLEGYNYLIDPSGVVLELCGPRVGEAVQGHNSDIVSLALMGDFRSEYPTLAAIVAASKVVNGLRVGGLLVPELERITIAPHSHWIKTECPGPRTRSLGDSGAPLEDWVRFFALPSAT